ncbi:MAG TPA: ABC transporter permease [Anaerolineae bacterium]
MATDSINRPPFHRRFNLFWRTVIARSYPRVIGQQREKSWLVFEIVLPMLITCSYVFVYKAIGASPDYIGYVVLGGAMSAFWLNVLWSMSSQLYWEKQQGNLALYIAAPNSMMAILLGMALGGLFATSLRALVIVITGSVLFGVTYSTASLLPALLVFLLTMVALYGLGMLFASVFLLFGREAWHTSSLLQEPVYLAAGFYFPVKNLPVWVAAIASLIPVTLGLDAMRQLLFSGGGAIGFLPLPVEVAALAVLGVAFLLAAKWALNYLEMLARREGRLTERRR